MCERPSRLLDELDEELGQAPVATLRVVDLQWCGGLPDGPARRSSCRIGARLGHPARTDVDDEAWALLEWDGASHPAQLRVLEAPQSVTLNGQPSLCARPSAPVIRLTRRLHAECDLSADVMNRSAGQGRHRGSVEATDGANSCRRALDLLHIFFVALKPAIGAWMKPRLSCEVSVMRSSMPSIAPPMSLIVPDSSAHPDSWPGGCPSARCARRCGPRRSRG